MNKEFFFVKFPIIFPIIYGFLIFSFPHYEIYVIFLFILLLAEPHFAATWPFFLDKVNRDHIIQNKSAFIVIPILIIILSLIGFFYSTSLFLLVFFAANVFHVARQSYGIAVLYLKKIDEKIYQEYSIYFFNLIFFLIGVIRFYLSNSTFNSFLYEISFGVSLLLTFNFINYFVKYGLRNIFTLISGTVIFYPVCFVDNPVHVIIMSVTIHYSQYLFFTHKIFIKRNENEINYKKKLFFYFLIISIYSIFMSFFSISKSFELNFLKNLLIIPIIGQMLHFYLDSQLWRFSIKHNRNNVLNHIIKI